MFELVLMLNCFQHFRRKCPPFGRPTPGALAAASASWSRSCRRWQPTPLFWPSRPSRWTGTWPSATRWGLRPSRASHVPARSSSWPGPWHVAVPSPTRCTPECSTSFRIRAPDRYGTFSCCCHCPLEPTDLFLLSASVKTNNLSLFKWCSFNGVYNDWVVQKRLLENLV